MAAYPVYNSKAQRRRSGQYLVTDFGAAADGETDDSAAIQDAIDYAAANGGGEVVVVGSCSCESALTLSGPNITLRGTANAIPVRPRNDYCNNWPLPGWLRDAILNGTSNGSTLLCRAGAGSTTGAFITSQFSGNAVLGLTICHPDQGLVAESGTPTSYPWAIRMSGSQPTVRDVALTNAYRGIFMDGCFGARCERINFQCYDVGIQYGDCHDICYAADIEHEMLWDATAAYAGDLTNQWSIAHAVAYKLGRMDVLMASKLFAWGCATGFLLYAQPSTYGTGPGSETWFTQGPWAEFADCSVDVCGVGVDIQDSQPFGLRFTGGTYGGGYAPRGTPGPIVRTGADFKGIASFSNCQFRPETDLTSVLHQGDGWLRMGHCTFSTPDGVGALDTGSQPEISQTGGGMTVSDCLFLAGRPQGNIGASAARSVWSGNIARGSARVTDASGNYTSSSWATF